MSELPLCQECGRLESVVKVAQKDNDTAEDILSDAECDLEQAQIDLKDHREGRTEEDDPFLLHQLAEKMGQTRMF